MMSKQDWVDSVGQWMPDAAFDNSASFDELAVLRAENARLRADLETVKQENINLRLEMRQMDEAFDKVQAWLFSVKPNTPAKVVKEIFVKVRDEIDLAFNPLNLSKREFHQQHAA